jgi:glycosyltransferase involved in cell wall biosynthesis
MPSDALPASPVAPTDVTFVIRRLDHGGAQRQLAITAAGLAGLGWRVAVATFYPGGVYADELAARDVPLVTLHKRGATDLLAPMRALRRWWRESRTRVSYAYLTDANVFTAAAALVPGGPPVVWGLRATGVDFSAYGRVAALSFAASRLLARRAALCIANSAAGAAYHTGQGYPAQRMAVVPNGLDTETFAPDAAAGAAVRASLGLGPRQPVVGIVARLDPMKGHDTLLQALVALRAAVPEVVLVVVGDGPPAFADGLRQLAHRAGVSDAVRWLGARSDIRAVLNACTVTVLPSRYGEGFPNAVGESMACGVPAVVTDVGDAAHVVGDASLVVPVGDAAALARTLAGAMARASDLGAAARRRAVEEFGVARMVSRTAELLEPLRRLSAG